MITHHKDRNYSAVPPYLISCEIHFNKNANTFSAINAGTRLSYSLSLSPRPQRSIY